MKAIPSVLRTFPQFPILGWSAFTGEYATSARGVLNTRHRRYTLSGRAAIALALEVLEVTQGDKVLVPTYHCPTMIAPVVRAGAQPTFYPLDVNGEPDFSWLEQNAREATTMLVAHYFGFPQPMAKIRSFCAARGITLIEDCAHALFGDCDGRPVGTWGDVAVASLTKFFPVAEGGLIASETRALEGLALRRRGFVGQLKAALDAAELGARHDGFPGLNSMLALLFLAKKRLRGGVPPARSGELLSDQPPGDRLLEPLRPAYASRCIARWTRRARIVELRRRNYALLSQQLLGLAGTRMLRPHLPDHVVPYVFPLYVEDAEASYQQLRAARIPLFRWDKLWPDTPIRPGDSGTDWASHVFQLGCHQDLSVADIRHISATVRTVIAKP